MHLDRTSTDILILGAGGAGLLAALHAKLQAPGLEVLVAVKGLLGKCGCTRMVQGGYNVALSEGDSIERHFMDTIEGGKWLNHQELAWTLVTRAPERVLELENRWGCFFDRNPDGTLHQKAFAGQTFDRTVHKGDLTGIEIMSRLAEQAFAAGVVPLEDHRALALVPDVSGARLSGALLLDMRTGDFRFVQARATLLATGGGPTMYRYHTPSGDKTCDGMAMALRAGLALRDMEMVQFHPTGLIAGSETRITGTIIEEGLRGAGGHLLDGEGRRFMPDYDTRAERATRDLVSRAMYEQMLSGRTGPNGGVYITMRHLNPVLVRRQFKGMVERCADVGFDLVSGLVEVVPTAHYMMGGVEFRPDCTTPLEGLFAAGEDTGGVHGANRLGGNGVANSTVFGGIAGDIMAPFVRREGALVPPDKGTIDEAIYRALGPFDAPSADLNQLRERLASIMWDDVGIIRDEGALRRAAGELDDLAAELGETGIPDQLRAFNLTWHDWLNLDSQITVARAICAAALARKDSRGAHYRSDHAQTGDLAQSAYTNARLGSGRIEVDLLSVAFTRVRPGQTLLMEGAGAAAD
jgi:fumarate reductase flavoprotein subunit